MVISDTKSNYQLSLESIPANIVYVEPFIVGFCNKYCITDEVYGNMLVCLTEAVNNAIIHGNKSDKRKQVHLEIFCGDKKVTCSVRDEGNGFDFNHIPDPTSPENIENTGGRGIFLMKHLADMVIFSNEGSNVEIQFKL